MSSAMSDKLKAARKDNEDAVFTLFTLAGHVVSGRITALADTVRLEAGKEAAEVPLDRIEAFSFRRG
jgi:hypothetical protein